MKKRISKQFKNVAKVAIVQTFIFSLFLISCGKNNTDANKSNTGLKNMATTLNSRVLSGTINTTNTEDGLSIIVNNDQQTILLEKVPNTQFAKMGTIQSGEIITSNYGIIIKDIAKNKLWFFVNNDERSIKIFEKIKDEVEGNYEYSRIFGSTIIKAENS